MTTRYSIHTNPLSEVEVPLDLRVRRHSAQARKLQAEAMAEGMANSWHALTRALPALWGSLVRWNQRVQTREALEACSERTLADIGIPREHIALVAKGVDHRDPVALARHGWQPRLVQALHDLGVYQPAEQRRVRRELGGYTDRELNEIGINRGDIPAIARTA